MDLLLVGVSVRLCKRKTDRPLVPRQRARAFDLYDQMLDTKPGKHQVCMAHLVVHLGRRQFKTIVKRSSRMFSATFSAAVPIAAADQAAPARPGGGQPITAAPVGSQRHHRHAQQRHRRSGPRARCGAVDACDRTAPPAVTSPSSSARAISAGHPSALASWAGRARTAVPRKRPVA